jgi:hypothetical protein
MQKYLGTYRDAAGTLEFNVLIQNQQLAVRLPNGVSVDLLAPDATGRQATNLGIAFAFEESAQGAVVAMNLYRPCALPVMRLASAANGPALPTVDEIIKLRGILSPGAMPTMRTTGRVRFPQSGVDGRFTSSSAGDDRMRLDLDLDRFGQARVALNRGRAWRAGNAEPLRELAGKELAQTRLGHPSVIFGDWREYYDAVRVVRAGVFEGRKIYLVRLESAGLPATLLSVDAETGDVLQDQRTTVITGIGALPVTTTYADYRVVGRMRVPHRYVESNDQSGRTIYEVERVEVGVELDPDIFTIQSPTAASSR